MSTRRRLYLLLGVILMTTAGWTMLSTTQLHNLVDSEDQDLEDQSWLARAERNMLELPQRITSLRGGLTSRLGGHHGSAAAGGDGGDPQSAGGAGAAARSSIAQAVDKEVIAGQTSFLQPENQELAVETSNTLKATGQCRMQRNQDCWGEILQWGPSNKKDSAEECCQSCSDYKPVPEADNMECNVWVYCEDPHLCGKDYKDCWLKHKAQPLGANVAPRGPQVGWTTGIMVPYDYSQEKPDPSEERRFHVVVTAQSTVGMHWASRVAYYWYKKVKALCEKEGNCQMGGFTRLLHDGKPDDLMNEIPTWVAQPLPPEHPDHGYVVLNRPYAFMQWVQQATIPEKYVLMSEPDHIWVKPMPNLMHKERPAAFPFFYIEPWKKEFLPITSKFTAAPVDRQEAEKIAPIGNAPTLMSVADLKRLAPVWFNMSLAVHADPDAVREWGWVQEMYAFTLACHQLGIEIDLQPRMMAHPPYDSEIDRFYIIHFTYGDEYTANGEMIINGDKGEPAWKFNKRDFYTLPPPRGLPELPLNVKNDIVRWLIRSINEAADRIPGWDAYAATGRAEQLWDGALQDLCHALNSMVQPCPEEYRQPPKQRRRGRHLLGWARQR